MTKYNIALIPAHNHDQFVLYAQTLSNTAPADRYHIGRGDSSIPHVSLCHFACNPEQLDGYWAQVQALTIPPLSLSFGHHLSKSFPDNPKYEDISWISLIPAEQESLKNLHLQICAIIEEPLNRAYEHYEPHMTLFNSRSLGACAVINHYPHIVPAFQDAFKVVVGQVDEVGQLINVYKSL